MQLNTEQLTHYREQGYLVLPGLIDQGSLDAYNEQFLAYVNGAQPLPEAMKIMQDVTVNSDL